jgi:hypothetical protein
VITDAFLNGVAGASSSLQIATTLKLGNYMADYIVAAIADTAEPCRTSIEPTLTLIQSRGGK